MPLYKQDDFYLLSPDRRVTLIHYIFKGILMRQENTFITLKAIVSILMLSCISLFAETTELKQSIDKNAESGSSIIEEWKNFSDTDIKKPSNNLSSVVVFRPLDSVNGPAVNIYIDGEYQSSLLAGAYTQRSLCPGSHYYSLAYTNVLNKYKEKKRVSYKSSLTANKISYYKIDKDNKNKLRMQELSENSALALIKKLPPRQHHTISRINKRECSQRK